MAKVEITEEMDTQIRKLALFDCSEGLTKPVSEDELYRKYTYIRKRIEVESFDINWFADNVLEKHRGAMEDKVSEKVHESISDCLNTICKSAKELIIACFSSLKLKNRNDKEVKED